MILNWPLGGGFKLQISDDGNGLIPWCDFFAKCTEFLLKGWVACIETILGNFWNNGYFFTYLVTLVVLYLHISACVNVLCLCYLLSTTFRFLNFNSAFWSISRIFKLLQNLDAFIWILFEFTSWENKCQQRAFLSWANLLSATASWICNFLSFVVI